MAQSPALTPLRRRLILCATITGSSMASIDASVVNVALPTLQQALGFDGASIQWVINFYLLALGALVLVGGAAADRFGRRKVFLIGTIVFTLSSAVCGLATGPTMLILARGVQGAAAALLTPASLAIVGSSFGDAERGQAIGIWAGFVSLTNAAGPVLGGWIVDHLSWRAIFLINVPLAVLTIVMATAVPEVRVPGAKRLDYAGAALVIFGIGAVIWALTQAADVGLFATAVLAWLAAGIAALIGFVVVEARSPAAMAPVSLFRSRDFSGVNLLTLCLYFALGGAMFFLPFELIRVHLYSAGAAGASLLPMSLMLGGLSRSAGRLSDRIGPRIPLTIGPLTIAAGLLLLARAAAGDNYWTGFFPATVVLAIGLTVTVVPLTTVAMSAVGDDYAGTASGINIAIARIATLVAVAILSLVFLARFDGAIAASAILPADRPAPGSGFTIIPHDATDALQVAEIAALNAAYVRVMLVSAAFALLGGLVAAVTISGRHTVRAAVVAID
jgi:EmrB/QacA subfamily drug resistance transporter